MQDKAKGISCAEIFDLIPVQLVQNLEKKTKVNYQVKKLTGEIMLKLLLFSLLNSDRISLRIMAELCHSPQFKILAQKDNLKTRHSTLSDRIANIDYRFFEKIFIALQEKFHSLRADSAIFSVAKYDSTLVRLSAKLLKFGMKREKSNRFLKFTIGLKGGLPQDAKLFQKQSEISEEIALKETILGSKYAKDSIVIFDRGLQSRQTFSLFTNNDILFITRAKSRLHYKQVRRYQKVKGVKTKTLILEKDLIVNLKNKSGRWLSPEFRLIIARSKKSQEKLLFFTNVTHLDAESITDIYKERWEMETFFKFLKQELNFKHLVSRTENGIKVMFYATLILAILIIVYKKLNKISSYKIAKIRFANELEMEIVKYIVILCGGDIAKFFGPRNPYPI